MPIPLFALILVAVAAGLPAALVARRYRVPRAPRPPGRFAARMNPEELTGLALTVALIVVFAGGVLLGALAIVVRESHVLSGLDSAVADWGDDHANGASTSGLKLVTDLGETWMAIVVVALTGVIDFVRTRSRWTLPFLLAVLAGDKLLTDGLKSLVDRVRPAFNPVAHTLGPSFPSGHSSTAAAIWAAAALVAWRWLGRRALPALAGGAVAVAVAVAASRVLLDVHWLTDVIAGLALGWAWFAACAIAFGRRMLRPGQPSTPRRKATTSSRTSSRLVSLKTSWRAPS